MRTLPTLADRLERGMVGEIPTFAAWSDAAGTQRPLAWYECHVRSYIVPAQYFITHSPQPHLDGHYTVFGMTTAGFGALDRLVQGDCIVSVSIT